MTAATNYLESAVLNHVLRNTSYTQPTGLRVALFTADPGETGSTAAEVGAGLGYSRQVVAFNAATTVGNIVSAVNTAAIEFGPATGGWGTITHLAIFDIAGSPNMLFKGALSVSKTITTDDSLRIGIGNLTITMD